MLGQKSDRRHYPASMTGLVASALGAPKVVMEACPGRRITCCATSAFIQPATQKCLREYPSAERAVASGTAGEVFAGRSCVDVSCRSDCCQKPSGPASGLGFGCEAYTPFTGMCVEPVGCGKLQTAKDR